MARCGLRVVALLLLALYTGCRFDAPVVVPPGASGGRLDAGSAPADTGSADAGPDSDAGVASDAAPPTDSGPPDSGAAEDAGVAIDAGTPDAGSAPDAAPRPDAAADAGPPPDSGVRIDAGFPDTGVRDAGPPDSGVRPDAGCTGQPPALPGSQPAGLGRVTGLGHGIDRPALVGDLDDDGFDELAVASAAAGRLTVVDWDDCGVARVTSIGNVAIGSGQLARLVTPIGPVIVTAGSDTVSRWRYRETSGGGQIQSVGTTPWTGAGALAGSPDGHYVIVNGRLGAAPGFLTLDGTLGTSTPTALDAALLGPAAYLAPLVASPMFVGTDARSPLILRPGLPPDFVNETGGVTPSGSPTLTRAGSLPSDQALIAYPATAGGPRLRTYRFGFGGSAVRSAAALALTSALIGPPIVLTRAASGPDEVRLYYVNELGVVGGCRLELSAPGTGTGAACDAVNTPIAFFDLGGAGEASPWIEPITSFVDPSPNADLVLAGATSGRIHFRAGNLALEVAPTFDTGLPIAGTPAISRLHLRRWGGDGDVMFVPHLGGEITMVGWPRDRSHGDARHLWPQSRHDAARSGGL